MFEVEASLNANILPKTKNKTLLLKTSDMKDDVRDDATDQPVSLQNEATRDAASFSVAAPYPIADSAAVSIIVPDAHIPSSGKNSTTINFLH